MLSVAVIIISVVEPRKAGSDELSVIEVPRFSQVGWGDAVQEILIVMPAGLVTTVGRGRIIVVPI